MTVAEVSSVPLSSSDGNKLEVSTAEFLAEVVESTVGAAVATVNVEYPLVSTIDSAAADLFGGELGDYELNEIPSLFNLDSQQMRVDLENLGLAAAAAASAPCDAEIPFIGHDDNSNNNNTDSAPFKPQEIAAVATTSNTAVVTSDTMAKKRSAAEISEDEDSTSSSSSSSSSTSSSSKTAKKQTTRRQTRSVATTGNTPIIPMPAPSAPTTTTAGGKLLAPKPETAPRRVSGSTAPTSTTTRAGSNGSISVHGGRRIDTSTAHIKALTGSKGAAMCFESVSGTDLDTTVAIPNLAAADSLTPEEKARFSRDRNRLHAKNTRIRKKAYVDELKRTLDVLVKERDLAVAAKNRKAQIESEERDVRFSVVQEFLRLRGQNEQVPARWSAILEDGATLCAPNMEWKNISTASATSTTSGSSKGRGNGVPTKKMMTGVTALMKECNEFNKQLKKGSKRTAVGSLTYQCDRSSLLMEGANVILDWTASSVDSNKSLSMRGTCRASFNPQSNKLHAVELFFDSTPLFAKNT
ncbi:expressed unknown protein [Seminavis robusta]|uniref:BZIP domain-containing protein n=1 Tax=Seminavis robusta TaxID=568900 RepID=A0A9N8D732_9STRA|nr:expressed unknown protein [Seminavis robusta]|eukprot:Sro24_g016460.1 n/a (525) ;mRNA; f:99444-101277